MFVLGIYFSFVELNIMRILSWGSNSHGQLGQGLQSEQTVFPSDVCKISSDCLREVKLITGGGKQSIFVNSDYILVCGDNDRYQLGNEALTTVAVFSNFITIRVEEVACGWDFNLVLTTEFEVFGWGSNAFGQLGLPRKDLFKTATPVKVFVSAQTVSAGLRHSAIANRDGFVFTAGFGKRGQLGYASQVSEHFNQVLNVSEVFKVNCGEHFTVCLLKNQQLLAWGDNRFGQLGKDCTLTPRSVEPVQVELPADAVGVDVHLGWNHCSIVTASREVYTWGRNDYGQLGESRVTTHEPRVLASLPRVKQLAVGSHHSVALTEKGVVYSWGWNEHANCGLGTLTNVFEPTIVKMPNVKIIGTGAAHSFACTED